MAVLDFVFPRKCLGCGSLGNYICVNCIRKQALARQKCVVCQRPAIDGMTHAKCKKKWSLDGVVSIWRYSSVVRMVLTQTKYAFVSEAAVEIAGYISQYLDKEISALPKNCYLVPVPLHSKREKWRGFNQAALLGKNLADKLNCIFYGGLVYRKKYTTPQVELDRGARTKNVLGAFAVNKDVVDEINKKTPIVILDDVHTTGSTLKEVGKVLKRAGFKIVWGLTVAS